ncbi:hypothetical protein ACFFKC_16665 [Pseudoduganella danionis]|uniref:Uncharacterized protein n=1 Tax=Pseudoduganella danionis TaxID=1890295 RepID=A0ABW9SS17_9BURK|nr:hypothetical protein [Pseudoduganella danionis]MTW33522.1 hypothetical protein [Pseudoduganella danionis]
MKDQINIAENRQPGPDIRPSLQGAASQPRDDNWRILQQLEHGHAHGGTVAPAASRPQHWSIDQWIIRLSLLIALICASAWYLHPRQARSMAQATAPAAALAPATRPAAVSATPAAQIPLTPAHTPVSPVSQNNQVAEIINSPASAEAADMTQPAVAAVMSAHPQRHEKGLLHKNPRPASPPDQMAARVASRVPAEAGADRDAALLAALVAHGSSSRDSATMANRDIVERQASDSTQHLLQRCQQLGMIEGMLCRSRICAGRWDSDQACRQPAP